MQPAFFPLGESDFPLLLKWLSTPHVNRWWGNRAWTAEKILQKYKTYPLKYSVVEGVRRSIRAYIVKVNNQPVGYIQYYDAYDFPRTNQEPLRGCPENMAGVDYYIGEAEYLGKGLGAQILKDFLKKYVSHKFQYCFVDPEVENSRAIKTYENLGFQTLEGLDLENTRWMVLKI